MDRLSAFALCDETETAGTSGAPRTSALYRANNERGRLSFLLLVRTMHCLCILCGFSKPHGDHLQIHIKCKHK